MLYGQLMQQGFLRYGKGNKTRRIIGRKAQFCRNGEKTFLYDLDTFRNILSLYIFYHSSTFQSSDLSAVSLYGTKTPIFTIIASVRF